MDGLDAGDLYSEITPHRSTRERVARAKHVDKEAVYQSARFFIGFRR